MGDEGVLTEYCQPGASAISVTVIECDDPEMVRDEVMWLKRLPEETAKGSARAISIVLSRLDDDDQDIRCAAVEALGELANLGDVGSVDAVRKRVNDSESCVRRAALEALVQLAHAQDPCLIDS